MTKHLILPDTQVRPGDDLTFLTKIGKYIVEKKPDTVIQIGDFADMPSLSSYDVGRKSFEGRRYKKDIEAAHEAMDALTSPLVNYNANARKNKEKQYKPRMVLTLGNHENRITRVIDGDPKLDGTISLSDLRYQESGFEVHPFLDVVIIDGIAYSHYFVSGLLGRPVTTAQALLNKKHMSCVAGHQQGRQIACATKADGSMITAIIAGSCYQHDEFYLGPQGNKHWRGLVVLHEVDNGQADEMFVSLDYINKKYA